MSQVDQDARDPDAPPPPPPPQSDPPGTAPPPLHDLQPHATLNTHSHASNADTLLSVSPSAPASSSIYPTFHIRKPSAAGLYLQTDNGAQQQQASDSDNADPSSMNNAGTGARCSLDEPVEYNNGRRSLSRPRSLHPTTSSEHLPTASNASPPSSVSSPALGALRDVTPLPSPIGGSSPDLWKRVARSRGNSAASIARDEAAGLLPPAIMSSPPRRRKQYYLAGASAKDGLPLRASEDSTHSRNRSLSEFVPETLQNIRPRNITTPGGAAPPESAAPTPPPVTEPPLHREQNFTNRASKSTSAAAPSDPSTFLPSPPASNRGLPESEETDSFCKSIGILTVKVGSRKRHWRPLRKLGEGAFSQVVLAAGEHIDIEHDGDLEIPPLVAIKIVKHNPDGGQSEDRMDTSIKREIEMLEQVSHPNLPHLMGFDDEPRQALVVLNYCAGGDLFDLASQRRAILTPHMIQRIFSELVDAVAYLHELFIVHRDIKLENVLVNIATEELAQLDDPRSIPQAVVTLTDLGLSRKIPKPPESPLLTHPCGSPDYAAPEILLGQAYDGRATDAWALGVLLYAMMEGRLPFDPLPGKRNTGNVKHRIARCDWLWCEYGDRFGEWIPEKTKDLEGAREIVEGLLQKRGRWGLDKVQGHAFCAEGTQVQGRLKRSYTAQF